MLSKHQQKKLDTMVNKYRAGMTSKFMVHKRLIDAWCTRYRIAMEKVLQRKGKY